MKFLAFDIEISKIIEGDFNQWKTFRPLGISCAATMESGEEPRVWYGKDNNGIVYEKMNLDEAQELVNFLYTKQEQGYEIVTWNGLGFDFNILAEESKQLEMCTRIALKHTDMMFHVFCQKGHPLGLDKAAKGLGLAGKTEGMSGDLAPVLWKQGNYQKVLEYVSQDARTTLQVAESALEIRELRWCSNSGTLQFLNLRNGWCTVEEALSLSEPDNSWMREPMPRNDFYDWMPKTHHYSNPIEKPVIFNAFECDDHFMDYYSDWESYYDDYLKGYCNKNEDTHSQQNEFIKIDNDECLCKICQGAPNMDPFFLMNEKRERRDVNNY